MPTSTSRKNDSGVDTEIYVKQMRRAMTAMEKIAGDTDTPIKDRVHALQRVVTFWQALIDELDPKRRPMDAAAD